MERLEDARPFESFDRLLERYALQGFGWGDVVTLRRRRSSTCRKVKPVGCQERGVGQQCDSLHHVRHFPYVPRPLVGDEGSAGVLGERFRRQPILGTGVRQEVFGESEDVLSPLSKRRGAERYHRKAGGELLAIALPAGATLIILPPGSRGPDVLHLSARSAQTFDRPGFA